MQGPENIEQLSKFGSIMNKTQHAKPTVHLENNIMAEILQYEMARRRTSKLLRRGKYCMILALALGAMLSNLNNCIDMEVSSMRRCALMTMLVISFLFLLDKFLLMARCSSAKRQF